MGSNQPGRRGHPRLGFPVTEDDEIKQDIEADSKEATDTKTEEKPKFTFWDWLYLAVVGAFSAYAIFWGVKAAIKMHRAAKNH